LCFHKLLREPSEFVEIVEDDVVQLSHIKPFVQDTFDQLGHNEIRDWKIDRTLILFAPRTIAKTGREDLESGRKSARGCCSGNGNNREGSSGAK
jgi:GR25 family glycosyltransferase involved in LPS biosynthesis